MSELSNEPTLNEQIGTLAGDTPLSNADNPLGEVTFSNSGPTSVGTGTMAADPMAKLHAPVVPQLKQHTTTTTTVDGVPANGGGPGQPSGPLPQNTNTGGLVGFARKFLGVPYVWGGTSPTGFDCSGFTQYVYRQFGVNLPRISADQARAGRRVSFDQLQVGDLVAIDNSSRNNGADHVGIYIGNGLVIDAPRPGRSVQIDKLSAFAGGWGVRFNFPGPRKPKAVSNTANKPHVEHP
jgi:cell wall-associated NlpC family hydrolase